MSTARIPCRAAEVFDGEFQSILAAMGEAKTVEAYTEAAGALQDWYAAHVPLIAL